MLAWLTLIGCLAAVLSFPVTIPPLVALLERFAPGGRTGAADD